MTVGRIDNSQLSFWKITLLRYHGSG